MNGVPDHDLIAAGNPNAHPQQLAEIAARRWDLHPMILANSQAFPALRQWISEVNPGIRQPSAISVRPEPPTPPSPPRRRGLGWLFAGCGCLTLVAGVIIALVLFAGFATPPEGADRPGDSSRENGTVSEHLAVVEAESAEYRRLAAQLEGNPVAALVTQPARFDRLQKRAESAALIENEAARLAAQARDYRSELEQAVTEAQARRTNESGTIAEQLVDDAGDGFIDIRWDADKECSVSSTPGAVTAGCVSEDPIAVHVLPPDAQRGGDQGIRLVVLHELTHLYTRAENDAAGAAKSTSLTMTEQGLFQGSSESFADCYALTYLNATSLESDGASFGYGYVCNDAERAAIRSWAAEVGAPLPGSAG